MTATNASEGIAATGVRKVIFASSLGTVFEWYDFYIYATLAPFFAGLFFPPGNATAAPPARLVPPPSLPPPRAPRPGAPRPLRHLRRRIPGAPVRRAGVRPHRRSGGTE